MEGVYLHIPFCKSRCAYCDFFSTTLLGRREAYTQALLREMELRKEELTREKIRTIYFGGGTPSLLETEQLKRLLNRLSGFTPLGEVEEITLEMNPGDAEVQKMREWREMGVNRLSMGVQSFHNEQLRAIGRRHTAEEAKEAVRMAKEAGFANISIDLIYGLPHQTMQEWKDDVEEALQQGVQHISTYCLSYEEGTVLTKRLEKGEISEIDDETENAMYDHICQRLKAMGWEHYEVSNFCQKGKHSRHNSSYWNNTPYVGLGAGAHSYDVKRREWNVADLDAYINAMEAGIVTREGEELTEEEQFNEQIMLGLRTNQGICLEEMSEERRKAMQKAKKWIVQGKLVQKGTRLVATLEGIHILNQIILDIGFE